MAERSANPGHGPQAQRQLGVDAEARGLAGALIFGPSDGQKVRFTRPDAWIGDRRPVAADPEAAAVEVARRYLAVHGPATREDLGRWWGVQPAPAGRLLQALGDAVVEVDVEGAPMWMLAADAHEAAAAERAGGVRLLPAFDQYVIAATRHAVNLMPRGRAQGPRVPQAGVDLRGRCVDGRL